MKRTLSTSLLLLAMLIGSALTATATASTPRVAVTAGAERAYRIDMATNRAVLKVSGAAVSQAERRAGALMTACLTRALVQINEQSQTNTHAGKALQLLSEEAGAEYEMAAIRPVMRPLLNGVQRLLTVHLPAAARATVKSFVAAFARVQSLNACADARAWLAAGLKPAREPRATAQMTVTLADFHRLGNVNLQAHLGDLPPTQFQALKLEKTRANAHLNQLIGRASSALVSWIRQLGLTVARESTTTTTSTTS